jgi:hypothetical protein
MKYVNVLNETIDAAINIGSDSYDEFVVFIIINADDIGLPKIVLKNAVIPTIMD